MVLQGERRSWRQHDWVSSEFTDASQTRQGSGMLTPKEDKACMNETCDDDNANGLVHTTEPW